MVHLIQDYLAKKPQNIDLEKFRLSELFGVSGPLVKWNYSNRTLQLAAKALRSLGGTNRPVNGYPYWSLVKSEGLDADF